MSTNCSHTTEILQSFCYHFNYYIPLCYLPIGLTGNLLNILTFTRPTLRTNSCTIFLLYSSIANLFHLTFGLVTRIVIDQYQYDIETNSIVFCKLKYYIMYTSASLSLYFVLLASINRYYQTKSHSRQWCFSQLFHPSKISLVLTLVNCLIYLHIPVRFRINHSSTRSRLVCYAVETPYRIFIDVYLVITWSLSTPCLMFIFGVRTIRNLQVTEPQRKRKFNRRTSYRKKTDIQLAVMISFQIVIIVCSTLPFGIQKLFSTFYPARTTCHGIVESSILCLTRHLSFTNSTFCFLFYILTARKFRHELISYFQEIFCSRCCERKIFQRIRSTS